MLADPAEPRGELGVEPHRDLARLLVGRGHDDVPEGLAVARRPLGRPGHAQRTRGAGGQGGRRRRALGEAHGDGGGRAHVVLVAADRDAGHGERLRADVGDPHLAGPSACPRRELEGTSLAAGERQQDAPGLGHRSARHASHASPRGDGHPERDEGREQGRPAAEGERAQGRLPSIRERVHAEA